MWERKYEVDVIREQELAWLTYADNVDPSPRISVTRHNISVATKEFFGGTFSVYVAEAFAQYMVDRFEV